MGILETVRRATAGNAASFWAKRQMDRSGLSDMLKVRPANAIPPQAYDLWNLFRLVRQRRPHSVFEFGVGCSSMVLAEALRRNGQGRLYTIDANEHWLGVAQKDFPDRLRERVTFIHSPLETIEHAGAVCSRYTRVPDAAPDFLYLDGPAPADIPGWPTGKAVCAADPVLLEPRVAPGFFMVVDGRTDNVAFLKQQLRRKYAVRHNEMFKLTAFELEP